MKIGIYSEPGNENSSLGGTEVYTAMLAEVLAASHQVEIIHHQSTLQIEQLAKFAGTNLDGVRLVYQPGAIAPMSTRNPMRRYRQARSWRKELSSSYDLFIYIGFFVPPFCHARHGALIILFPWLETDDANEKNSRLRQRLEYSYRSWEWQKRLDSFDLKITISQFSQLWAKRNWNIETQTLYPPTQTTFRDVEKENFVLSVGRFAVGGGVIKRQLETTHRFAQMRSALPSGWKYFCVGGLSDSDDEKTYFANVQTLGKLNNVEVLANLEWARLQELFERAKIFWHAAGYGVDENVRPHQLEHFGIVTVQAMSAGCVPVVMNRGGNSEIVQHGVNGFLWNTLDELQDYTLLLAHNDELRAQMSRAAKERSRIYGHEEFAKHALQLFHPFLQSS